MPCSLVFPRLSEVPQSGTKYSMASVRIMHSGVSVILAAIFLIVGTGLFIAVTILPKATITVNPKVITKQLSKEILLSSKVSSPDYVQFTLPANIVEKEIHTTKTFTQDSSDVVSDFATGTVKLTNNQEEEQRLLPKTHLKYEASGIFFLTNERVVIPPKSSVSVGVTAEEKGSAGEVPPGRFIVDKLPPNLQKLVFGESTSAFSGGQSVTTALTQETIDKAQQEVLEDAKKQAAGELTLEAKGKQIRPDLTTIEVISQQASAPVGSHAAAFTAEATAKARGFVVETHDIVSLMTLALRASVESDEEFIAYDAPSFELAITRTDWKAGTARVTAKLTGTYAKKISPQALGRENLAGLSKEEVIDRFKNSPAIDHVNVSLSPFWVRSVPSKETQIQVEVAKTQ